MNQDQHNSEFDPHEVDHGTMYYKMHGGAYKGHVRGIVRGLIVGCAIGAVVGLAMTGLLAIPALAAALHIAAVPAAGVMVSAFATFGGVMASGLMGRLGNAAGNVGSQLAEQELRDRYPEIQEISYDSPEPGFGYHYEVPADRDRRKPFHFRVGLTGGAIGAAFGALAGPALLAAMHISGLGLAAFAPVVIGAVMGGSFGINRSIFKSIFNVTDNFLNGRVGGPTEDELAKSKERYRRVGEDGPPSVINSLQRQEEYYRLQNGYYNKAFSAGFAGNNRGLVGGLISGGLVGTLLGAVTVTALGGFAIAGAPLLFAGIVAFSMHKGMHIFTEAGFEASGHSHVHEVFHERQRAMRKGINLDFDEAEKNIVKRRQADPELTPPEAQKKSWFNLKVAAVMAAVGALVGTGLAPLSAGVAKLLGVGHISSAMGAVMFGVTGATFGIGPKITGKLHNIADNVYHGAFFPGDLHPEIKTHGKIPLMSPNSELAEHFGKHLEQTHSVEKQQDPLPVNQQQDIKHQRDTHDKQHSSVLERGARSFTQHIVDSSTIEGVQR